MGERIADEHAPQIAIDSRRAAKHCDLRMPVIYYYRNMTLTCSS
jgi:hypothetical protein